MMMLLLLMMINDSERRVWISCRIFSDHRATAVCTAPVTSETLAEFVMLKHSVDYVTFPRATMATSHDASCITATSSCKRAIFKSNSIG